MDVKQDSFGARIDLTGAAAHRFVEIAKGAALGYDLDDKVVAMAFSAEPWRRIERVGRCGSGEAAVMTYDPEGNAMAIDCRTMKYVDSEEVMPSVIVDFDSDDQIRGVEVIYVSAIFAPEAIETLRAFTITSADVDAARLAGENSG